MNVSDSIQLHSFGLFVRREKHNERFWNVFSRTPILILLSNKAGINKFDVEINKHNHALISDIKSLVDGTR